MNLYTIVVGMLLLMDNIFATGTFKMTIRPTFSGDLRVCLKVYQSTVTFYDECSFGDRRISVEAGQEFNLDLPISSSWVENFTLIVSPTTHKGDALERFVVRSVIYGNGDEKNTTYSWNSKTEMSITYRMTCGDNYHGGQCAEFCEPTDNFLAHFTCSKEGKKICMSGWAGEICSEPICANGCGNGTCTAPGICKCLYGYKGGSCDECVPRRGCLHGMCEEGKPFTCQCQSGYGGLYCQLDLEYCARHKPCKNGGRCRNQMEGQYKCECPYGYSGRNCEVPMPQEQFVCHQKDLCLNGGSCVALDHGRDYKCLCPKTHDGKHCEYKMNFCEAKPCENGGICTNSKGSFECKCPSGFFGYRCQMPLEKLQESEKADAPLYFVFILIALALLIFVLLVGMYMFVRQTKKMFSDPNAQNALNSRFEDTRTFTDNHYKTGRAFPQDVSKKETCAYADERQTRYTSSPNVKRYSCIPQIDTLSIYEDIDVLKKSDVAVREPEYASITSVSKNIPYNFSV